MTPTRPSHPAASRADGDLDRLTRADDKRPRPPGLAEEGSGGPLIAVLADAWAAIRARHDEIPPVMLATGPRTSRPSGRRTQLGHFHSLGWWPWDQHDPPGWRAACEAFDEAIDRRDLSGALRASATKLFIEATEIRYQAAASLPEVFITFDGLRTASEILATLLHEAAHAIASHRGTKDTSRQGRYHNQRFKVVAEEVGLEVGRDADYGWTLTTLTPATATTYSETLADLERLQGINEELAYSPIRGATKRSLTCDCGQRWRTASPPYATHAAICGVCNRGTLSRH